MNTTIIPKIVIGWVLLALGDSLVLVADVAQRPTVPPGKNPVIEITRIQPSPADLRKARQKAPSETEEPQVHLVKVYLVMPPPRAESYDLYIGDLKINQYGGFDGGVFFKVYTRKELEVWRGKPVRFVFHGETIDLGVTFPPAPHEPPAQLPEMDEALRRK